MKKPPDSFQLYFILRALIILALTTISLNSYGSRKDCFEEAGYYFKIDPLLLKAIAHVESNMNPEAVGINNNSEGKLLSRDLGLMQINDTHLAELKKLGVIRTDKDLLTNPCLNIKVGAWILHRHFSRCGRNWQCLGTYNAGFSKKSDAKRREYIYRVYRIYRMLP